MPELPQRSVFPREMPRYPNLWFFVDQQLALRGQYMYALRFLVRILEQRLELRDDFIRDVENHNLHHLLGAPGEGSDFQARISPLQQFVDEQNPQRNHFHQLHARFYCSPLLKTGKESSQVRLDEAAGRFFLIPASVHYEVATEEAAHPYEDSCPFCGITGEYDLPIDRASEDYCVKIHDPLGLELLLYGTIRGQSIKGPNGHPLPSISDLDDTWNCRIEEYSPKQSEPRRLAAVFFYS